MSEIPASGTKTVYAEYVIPENENAEFTNTVELIGAIADEYDLDVSREYRASVAFQSEYYVVSEPVADSEDGSSNGLNDESSGEARGDDRQNGGIVNTLDDIVDYVAIGAISVIGVTICGLLVHRILKNEQLGVIVHGGKNIVGRINEFFNDATRPKLITMAVADVALIAIAAGLIIQLSQEATGDSSDHSTINLMSSEADFGAGEGGAWELTKSAKWIGDGEAEVTINVDTKIQSSPKKKDIVFAVDVSGSMEGDKLAQVKADMTELVDDLLDDQGNQVALVSFESEAIINFGFTNDKSLALNEIEDLETGNNTNYYDALTRVEQVLDGYSENENRELYILVLTDGLPTVGSPNEVGEYAYLKQAYPYATIGAVQYEMSSDSIFAPVARISDEQFIADMGSLHNTLYDVVAFPYTYASFTVTDFVNDEYFTIAGSDSVSASIGSATLTDENGTPKITWDMDGKLRSGSSAKLTIKLKLKDQFKRVGGEYFTNKSESVVSSIEGKANEDKTSTESPRLRNNYTVTYEANAPSDCTVGELPVHEERFVYQVAEISEAVPVCDGYNFAGYVVMSDVAKHFNEDFFRMPEADVVIKATWTKTAIEKKAEGEVYVAKTLYGVIASKSNGLDTNILPGNASSASNGQGVNTVATSAGDEFPIHYFRGNISDNNVIFAGYCWRVVRTTDTGGIKLLYNGLPTASGQCKSTYTSSNRPGDTDIGDSVFNDRSTGSSYSPAYAYYMYGEGYPVYYSVRSSYDDGVIRGSGSYSADFWVSESAQYGVNGDNQWHLVNAVQTDIEGGDLGNLIGKYTFGNSEEAYSSANLQYIVGSEIRSSKLYYYYIPINGNTTLESQNYVFVYGDSYHSNGDGTYTIEDPESLERVDYYEKHLNLEEKYFCKIVNNGPCRNVYYAPKKRVGLTRLDYFNVNNTILFSEGFTYENGEYYLDNDTIIEEWNFSDDGVLDRASRAHYTCLNKTGHCTRIYYVYDFATTMPGTLSYLRLGNGESIEDAIAGMKSNTINSSVKETVDAWYESALKGTDYETMIEDTIYCNDRSMASGNNSWDPNGGNARQSTDYGTSLRQKSPSLDCLDRNDAFTVSENNGNGALTYPIGLLTLDELTLSGSGVPPSSGNSGFGGFLYSGRDAWSMSIKRFGWLASDLYVWDRGAGTRQEYREAAVRPVISLIPGVMLRSGDGTAKNPWIPEKP